MNGHVIHILRATAQSSMLTQDMTDGIGHILRPFISCNQPYPAAIQIPHMPIPSVRSWPAPSNMLAIHFTRLATDGVSGNPGSNMPTRQLVSAHSTASNHSPTPPNNSRVGTPKVSTGDWVSSPQTPRIFRHSAQDAPGNVHVTQFSRASQDNIHYSLQEDLQTFGIGNLSRDYSTIRSLSIFVTCGFV